MLSKLYQKKKKKAFFHMELTFFESLEIKFLCFNILTYISGTTAISSVLKFKLAQRVR